MLRRNGFHAEVPDLTEVVGQRGPYYAALAAAAAAAVDDGADPVVVIAHSAAGALLPAVAEAVGDRTRGAVFVDAILPQPGRSWFDTAPPELAAQLRGLSDDGLLPPWQDWLRSGVACGTGGRPGPAATLCRRDSAAAARLLRGARAAGRIHGFGGVRVCAPRCALRPGGGQGRAARLAGDPSRLGSPAHGQRSGGGRRPYRAGDFPRPAQVMACWQGGACL